MKRLKRAAGGVPGRQTAAKLQVVAAGRELVADDGRGGDTCGTRAIVHTLEASRKSLLGKKESRRSSVIDGLLPRGSGTLALRVPRRMHFCEGAEGDAAHIEAMRDVVSNFSDAHIQDKENTGGRRSGWSTCLARG